MEGGERKWGLFGQSGEFGTRDLQCKVQREGEQEDIVNRSRGEHLQSEVLVACFADGRISHPGYCQGTGKVGGKSNEAVNRESLAIQAILLHTEVTTKSHVALMKSAIRKGRIASCSFICRCSLRANAGMSIFSE